jgi:1-acyl-sn-glycerol-3-phosphate acyltransferase
LAPRRSSGFGPAAYPLVSGLLPPARRLFRRFFPTRFSGRERAPDGAVVVAANHFSHLDPVLVAMAIDRPLRFLAVDELYGNSAFFDRLTLWLGAIPMSRTRPPLGALRAALETLASRGGIGMFPEGVRVWTWGEEASRRGAAWLALRAGVPLLPVAIAGSDQVLGREARWVSRRPMAVVVCDPILPGDYAGRSDPSREMTFEWTRRVDAALREVYETGGP